jgi:putative DNA-invertase from lambdoid prophage Rac
MIVAYARVSTDKQDAENQRFEIERYLERQGLAYDDFVDETISGTTSIEERRLADVLKSLKQGDTLIVSEVSRLSRNLTAILTTISGCIERGVTVVAVKENYVFDDSINSKVIAFAFGLAAEIERRLISQRTREALARKKAEGVKLGRPAGQRKPESRKLHGKDEEIMGYLDNRVSKAAIARMLGVNRATVQAFIEERDLEFQVRSRKLRSIMADEKLGRAKAA